MKNQALFIFILVFLNACGTTKSAYHAPSTDGWQANKPHSDKKVIHSLYLVGDTGELDDLNKKTNNVVEAVKRHLNKETGETSLVFLGDNIYPTGMPNKEDPVLRKTAEDIISAQLSAAKSHDGKTYFIPGNLSLIHI